MVRDHSDSERKEGNVLFNDALSTLFIYLFINLAGVCVGYLALLKNVFEGGGGLVGVFWGVVVVVYLNLPTLRNICATYATKDKN